jgi:hypothetical protein
VKLTCYSWRRSPAAVARRWPPRIFVHLDGNRSGKARSLNVRTAGSGPCSTSIRVVAGSDRAPNVAE